MFKGLLNFIGCAVATVLVATSLSAQEPPPPTRIAIINMGEVLTKYERAVESKKDMENAIAPYKKLMEQIRDDVGRLQKVQFDQAADADQKNAAAKKLVGLQKQAQEVDAEVRKVVGKKQEQQLVELFGDVEAVVQRHAEAQGFDLVLGYGDPIAKEDRAKFPNINRKFQAADVGGIVPIFIRPRIDITQPVLKSLNDAYSAKKK